MRELFTSKEQEQCTLFIGYILWLLQYFIIYT